MNDSPTALAIARIDRALEQLEARSLPDPRAADKARELAALEQRHVALRDQVARAIERLDAMIDESAEAQP